VHLNLLPHTKPVFTPQKASKECKVAVPEPPPQLSDVLRSSPGTTAAAAALGLAAAAYALLHRAGAWRRGGAAAAFADESTAAAYRLCEEELALTRKAAAALESELGAVSRVMGEREGQLAAVTAKARQQAEGARAALAASQAQVERLEGLAVALRERLGERGAAALDGLGPEPPREMVARFQELRRQLETAQVREGGGCGGCTLSAGRRRRRPALKVCPAPTCRCSRGVPTHTPTMRCAPP
jgi:hypothetical protein